jgi:hypothetical protein
MVMLVREYIARSILARFKSAIAIYSQILCFVRSVKNGLQICLRVSIEECAQSYFFCLPLTASSRSFVLSDSRPTARYQTLLQSCNYVRTYLGPRRDGPLCFWHLCEPFRERPAKLDQAWGNEHTGLGLPIGECQSCLKVGIGMLKFR